MNALLPNLTGIPETMLWTLHNRASESLRPDARLKDADAERLYRAIDYDYEKSFGTPDSSHAARSWMFDEALKPWLAAHPQGQVIELGCGLETQFQRCERLGLCGEVHWLCVDVPEAIDIRRRFLPETERCRYLAKSALDLAWLEEAAPETPVFISAQGLFMYFEEAEVRRLVTTIFDRFADATLMFDAIPRWFAQKSVSEKGIWKTRHYRMPPVPWGVNRPEIARTLKAWQPKIVRVDTAYYPWMRTFWGLVMPIFSRLPWIKNQAPQIVTAKSR